MRTTLFLFLCSMAVLASVPAKEPEVGEGPVVAVVLAGGGALGFAHIGVLEVLEEEGVQPDIVVGTSMGSVVGGMYAAGYAPKGIEAMAVGTDWHETLFDTARRGGVDFHWKEFQSRYRFSLRLNGDPDVSKAGFSHAQRVVELLDRLLGDYPVEMDFDDLPRRYRAVAADLFTGERIVYGDGDLKTAIRASMSVPGVFTPVRYRGRYVIDGGWVDNIPADVARGMGADIVITVPLADELETDEDEVATIGAVGEQAGRIRILEKTLDSLSESDLVISPDLRGYTIADFESSEELIALGYAAANSLRPDLREIAALQRPRSATPERPVAVPSIAVSSLSAEGTGGDARLEALRNDLLTELGRETSPEEIRETVYGKYDTGSFHHVWYQLIPVENGEYRLALDASIREKQSQLGLSFNSRIFIMKSLQSVSSLNLGYQRYLGRNYLWGFSANAEVSDFPDLEWKIFVHPFGIDSMVYLKGYMRIDPLFHFSGDSVESVYSSEWYGSSLGLKFAFLRRVGITCGGFGEFYRRSHRQGGELLTEGTQWLYGFSVLLEIDTLDRLVGPRRGVDAECLVESISYAGRRSSYAVKTVVDGYIPVGDSVVVNPRFENLTLAAGSFDPEVLPALGTALSNYGYFSQEIRGMNVVLACMRVRFRAGSLPLVAGDDVYLQLVGNLNANWNGNLGGFSDGELRGAGAFGIVAVTTLGELEASLCLNSERRFSGLIGLTMSRSFFKEP